MQLPDAPPVLDAEGRPLPIAQVVPAPPTGTPVHIEAAQQQRNGHTYTLTGEVTIHYRDYILRADKVRYNQETGDIEAEGHLQLEGGPDDETISADHGTVNIDVDSARFYNVIGTVGMRMNATRRKVVYTGINPFLFTGRVVIQEGPRKFRIVGGSMTSCRLPHPDWRITARDISVGDGTASTRNAAFRLLNVPILFLPYLTHPVGNTDRETGLLVPVYSNSGVKGTVLGEDVFFVLGRSMDLLVGLDNYSRRGVAPSGEFRYRGRDDNYADLRFTALFDRGVDPKTHQPLHQGGTDIILNGARSLDEETRAVANLEYLSSYQYRNVFANSFAQAVASQVDSSAFLTRNQKDGASESVYYARYISYQGIPAGDDILISHQPQLDYNTLPRYLGRTPVTWQLDASIGGLNRREPGTGGAPQFNTPQEVGRVDLHPVLALPLHLEGWSFRPRFGLRDTFYAASQSPGLEVPTYRAGSADRKSIEVAADLRPPAIVRDFNTAWLPGPLGRALGSDARHVIATDFAYNYRRGIHNFPSILRFDATDVVSNDSELKFSLHQRLYFRNAATDAGPDTASTCHNPPVPTPVNGRIYLPVDYRECGGATHAWIDWDLTGAYFFNPHFGGAVLPFRRNVLDSTLDLTGISFLSGPRNVAPVISRFAIHTGDRFTAGWDYDYDTKAGRMDNSNVYATVREGNYFGSIAHDRLNQLRSQSAAFLSQPAAALAILAEQESRFTPVTAYNQLQLTVGYGANTKPGLSLGANNGYDYANHQIEYYGIQAGYNWACCGLTFEYSRINLGAQHNEPTESFNFTIAGVGTAGNTSRSKLVY